MAVDGTASWTLDLDANGLELGAEAAAEKLEELQKEIRKTAEIQKSLRGGGEEARKAAAGYTDKLAAQKAEAKKLNLVLAQQGTTLREQRDRQKQAKEAEAAAQSKAQSEATSRAKAEQDRLAASAKAHKWDLDRAKMTADWNKRLMAQNQNAHKWDLDRAKMTSDWNKQLIAQKQKAAGIARARSAANVQMFGIIAKGAASAVGFVVALAGAMSGLILLTQGARREERLRFEGLVLLRRGNRETASAAAQLQASVDRVSASSAASREQVSGYAEQLYRAGLRGKNLRLALEGTAIVATTQGDAMAQAFMGQAAAAGYMGTSVEKLTDTVKARLGGIAARQALGLGVQVQKLKENLSGLMKGINIEPFLRGLNIALSVFREGESVAEAWKMILESIFGSSFTKGETAGKLLKRAIQGGTIAALDLYIAAQKLRIGLEGMVPMWIHDQMAYVWAKVDAGEAAFRMAGQAVGAFGDNIKGAGRMLVGALFGPIGVAIALGWNLYASFKRIGALIKDLGWVNLGKDIVRGIASGIKGAANEAIDANLQLAKDIKNKLVDFFEIHSPSRLMAREIGRQIPRGIGAGEKEAMGAATAPMIDAFDAAIPSRGATGGSAGISVTIGDIVIQSSGGDPVDDLRARVTALFEDLATQLGARA